MNLKTPRTDAEIFHPRDVDGDSMEWEAVDADISRQLEVELNQWREIAKNLAENGGGLGVYSAGKYLDAIDEYKRMAAMPNDLQMSHPVTTAHAKKETNAHNGDGQ